MNIEEQFKKVEKVDAPPLLFDQITAKIEAQKAEKLPVAWPLAGGAVFGLLLFFNVLFWQSTLQKNDGSRSVESLAKSMELNAFHSIYDE